MKALISLIFFWVFLINSTASATVHDDIEAAYGRGDYAAALTLLRPLAAQNSAGAQNMLGVMYGRGQGVPENAIVAIKWYRLAAAQSYAPAEFNLGSSYERGVGVVQDYVEAIKWYRKAAQKNYIEAQNSLGLMYEKGLGVAKDTTEAAKWFQLVAQGKSQLSAGSVPPSEAKNKDDRKFTEVLKDARMAASQGDVNGQYNLGVLYAFGQGVPQNYAESAYWFRLAAEQGEPKAQFNLAVSFERGRGVIQNFNEAANWYRKAAAQGYRSAQYNLGMLYANGQGVQRDDVRAYMWLSLVALAGDADAAKSRDFVSQRMSPEQMMQAQQSSRDCQRWKFRGCY